jgi:hypothetical protein
VQQHEAEENGNCAPSSGKVGLFSCDCHGLLLVSLFGCTGESSVQDVDKKFSTSGL